MNLVIVRYSGDQFIVIGENLDQAIANIIYMCLLCACEENEKKIFYLLLAEFVFTINLHLHLQFTFTQLQKR